MFIFRCVDDGYCTSDHADLIQKYVEKKLRNLYKIDETVGKSLFTIEDEDELDDDDIKDRKSMIISDDENSDLSTNGAMNRSTTSNEKSSTHEPMSSGKHLSLLKDNDTGASSGMNSSNRHLSSLSVSPSSKGNLSPGEIAKPISPSSLSEASPILD